MKKKKKLKKSDAVSIDEEAKKRDKPSNSFGFGDPDDYDPSLPIGHREIVEFHARAHAGVGLEAFRGQFSGLLPREQVSCLQQVILFDQMIGRLVETASQFAFEEDYQALIRELIGGVKRVLRVRKVRIFGVEYNSLGQTRELWVVGGETGNLGRTISVDEWCGFPLKTRNAPVISNAPRTNIRYGAGYLAMEGADKKFDISSLCSVAVRMRDQTHIRTSGTSKPRYVVEAYNKERHQGKGLRDFDECDGYVLGCLARTCGAAIQWAQGNVAARRTSEFAHQVLNARTLQDFSKIAVMGLRTLFGCEDVAIFWIDVEMSCLWRFKTDGELEWETRIAVDPAKNAFGSRIQTLFNVKCLAAESLGKVSNSAPPWSTWHTGSPSSRAGLYRPPYLWQVNMSDMQEQFVTNVTNAPKHVKFDPEIDGIDTVSMMSVPIVKNNGSQQSLAVVQLRNKLSPGIGKKDASGHSIFRADDQAFLQYFARQASTLFEQAVSLDIARETEEHLEQSRYCVSALMSISNKLSSGTQVEELFPVVVHEATKLMHCDRATLFLLGEDDNGASELWSKVALGMPPIRVPLKTNSIAGATVVGQQTINIADAYKDERFDPRFDKKCKYRTRSILCVPIIDLVANQCIGCLQLINKKDKFDRAEGAVFKGKDQEIARNFCSVVAIAVKGAKTELLAHGTVGLFVNVTN